MKWSAVALHKNAIHFDGRVSTLRGWLSKYWCWKKFFWLLPDDITLGAGSRKEPTVAVFCALIGLSIHALAPDWLRQITWPESWSLIGWDVSVHSSLVSGRPGSIREAFRLGAPAESEPCSWTEKAQCVLRWSWKGGHPLRARRQRGEDREQSEIFV